LSDTPTPTGPGRAPAPEETATAQDGAAPRRRGRPSGGTALWEAIAAALSAEIADGAYGTGDRLPSETALAARFGVNRHTVRHALKAMAQEGLVHARRGAGVFVQAQPVEYPIGRRVRFHRNLAAAGSVPGKEVRDIERRGATEREAAALDILPGAAICILHGRSTADGQPIALFQSHFPEARLGGIAEVLRETASVTEALARCGVEDYTRAETRISARAADAMQAAQLHLRPGAALIYQTALNVDAAGRPVEYGRTWFAGERVTLSLEA
jgi:GntR family phosphonate transport system transcriptional regulator